MSKKYYLIWKDVNCNGVNPEWVFMTGKDLYKFIKNPENKNRYFMTLDDRVCKDADIITMECTRESYKEWRIQKNHEDYLDRFENEREFISINSYIPDSETMTYEEVIADESVDIEDDLMRVVKNQLLKEFFEGLSEKEKNLINILFIENDGKNEFEIAKEKGIAQQTLNNRKLALRKKLKNFLGKNGF